jgi:hypothetical protein
MKYMISILALFLTACAGHGSYVANEQPAYWMKQYANADQAKINTCMAASNAAYDKKAGNTAFGVDGWAVLAKGNAWEKCMES